MAATGLSAGPGARPGQAPGLLDGFREGLRALTTRGRAFVAGGLTAVLCGVILGERDMVRIGALIVLLPLVTVGYVVRTGHRLNLARTITPNRIEVDQQAVVQLDLTNLGSRTGLLLVEEQVPWALGQRPRFVIDSMQPGWHRRVEYPLRATVRGIYEIGPMELRVADPFGLMSQRRGFARTSTLVVVPNAEPLPPIRLSGAWAGTGDNRPRPFSTGGTADATVREYRMGDDLRRVHWRSTARTGELMVRREEQPWQSRCTLLVDNRSRAHRGTGPESSLERAITVTASIAVHLTRAGFQVRLVTADGEADPEGAGHHTWHDVEVGAGPVLERLAALPTSRALEISTAWIDETVTSGMFIGVLGATDERDRALLARLHNRGSASYAVVLDVDSWTSRGTPGAGTTPTTSWLQQRGWKASDLSRTGSLQTAWQGLGR
ncbi:MAG: DUF58 domain-containing protein [Marmoricola sp.]